MDLKTWTPLPYLDKEWRIEFPRFVREVGEFRPSMDVVRTDGQLVLTAELPGMSKRRCRGFPRR
jgi:HSP20 family molecular chaperone IbpA